jgi:hypothetical protein
MADRFDTEESRLRRLFILAFVEITHLKKLLIFVKRRWRALKADSWPSAQEVTGLRP